MMKNKIFRVVMVATLLATMLFGLTACGNKDDEKKSGPEKVAKEYFEDIGEKDFTKAFKLIDWQGYVMTSEEDIAYEDLEDEYEDFGKEYEDEIAQMQEIVEQMGDYMKEAIEDYEKFSVKVKNVEDAEKVEGTKNVYCVEVEVKTTIKQEDDEEEKSETETYEIYVMKKDSKYYVVGGIDDFMESL